ncbi:phosphatase PAP2 family protein [Amycolatopsis acidicola]|uniref:Phosphatase PAP2 family protein n=1 Tax=Amycolatopsis acidicola TaxID=2596893 RepID=A0A5N0UTH4_9PSEU|nr:phosphatase PAP2 family protein [Amycolatopsis acidicola]KAA9154426.1 phosphatase PAP2 family protein [Amycolatopsis acidicola]
MIRWLVTGVVTLALFVALGAAVTAHPLGVDLSVASAFQGWWRGTGGELTKVASDWLGLVLPAVFAVGMLLGAALCVYRGRRHEALVLVRVLVVYGLCRLTSPVGKPLFLRVRPRVYAEFSYPSGHVVSAASAGLAAVLLCVWLAPKYGKRVALVASVWTAVVALTRLMLGVHWLTDTVGAVLAVLGVGLVAASVLRLLPGPVSARADAA